MYELKKYECMLFWHLFIYLLIYALNLCPCMYVNKTFSVCMYVCMYCMYVCMLCIVCIYNSSFIYQPTVSIEKKVGSVAYQGRLRDVLMAVDDFKMVSSS